MKTGMRWRWPDALVKGVGNMKAPWKVENPQSCKGLGAFFLGLRVLLVSSLFDQLFNLGCSVDHSVDQRAIDGSGLAWCVARLQERF